MHSLPTLQTVSEHVAHLEVLQQYEEGDPMLHKLITFMKSFRTHASPAPPPKTASQAHFVVTPEGIVSIREQHVLPRHDANSEKSSRSE